MGGDDEDPLDVVVREHQPTLPGAARITRMDVLRTPDDRFADLPGYSFAPHYVEVPNGDGGSLRVHHLDEGPADGAVIVLLHGEPSWAYLYRKMVPILAASGARVIVPDLVGFGRSDKPASRDDYTYAAHVEWMRATLFDQLALADVTLVGQDWGGLIGLRLVGEHPERFARVVAANTYLPTGDRPAGDAFLAWQKYSQETPEFHVGAIVNGGCTSDLPTHVVAAYDAPFPDESYKEGARQFPLLVPTSADDPAAEANRAAWTVLEQWERPFLCAFSDRDPITGGADRVLKARIPGAAKQPHTTIEGAGHFLQEDAGEQLAAVIVDFLATTRGSGG
jgi:haloalkane dehalogenase